MTFVDLTSRNKQPKKINRLTKPKEFSIRPVLIHCHDVSDQVKESGFFAKIINFTDYLEN